MALESPSAKYLQRIRRAFRRKVPAWQAVELTLMERESVHFYTFCPIGKPSDYQNRTWIKVNTTCSWCLENLRWR